MAGSKAVALLFLLVNLTTASVIPRGEASSSAVAASASASAEASCWRYTLPTTLTKDDIEQNEDDTTSSTRRRGLNYFDRRDHTKTEKLGTCDLGQTIYKPKYFRSKNIQTSQNKVSGYSFLGYFIPKLDTCDAAVTFTTIANAADVSKTTAGYWDDVEASAQQKYLDLGAQINKNNQEMPHINVDHVYELQILDAFLTAMIDEYKFCDSFKEWFLTIDSTFKNKQGVNKPRLQKLYSYLPGETYPDLVAMDSRLNSYKAPMFGSEELSGMASVDGTGDARQGSALSIMNTLAVVVSMLRDNSVATYFKNANTRMYKAFLGIDDLMSQQKSCNQDLDLPQPKNGWASAYESWMDKFLSTQAAAVSTRISSVSAQVTSTEAAGAKNVYGKALDAFNEKYPTASWKWDNGKLLDWSATDGTAFAKRDASSAAVCTPTATPSSSAVKSHSASSKATPSQTGTANTASETASHTVKSTVTSSSQKATITPATSTSTKAETTTKSKHGSGSSEAAQTTKSTSSKPKDTSTATTKSSSSSAKDTATITSTKTTSTATPDSKDTSTKDTSTKDTSTKDTTTTTSTSTKSKETTTSTKTSTTTKSTKTATKTTTKSSKETEDSSSSSSSCKKKKCKKGKCTCVS
ncbi:hypothetical protein ASPTUDRAFT_173987 [Aspergillus tubingensis CBS 134.48]|uniref:Alginate lyase domain-containing protein n=1 Tax=Aspergillus tubingensis (strain CBS 134.48) TaxID=767770 RepID=A0A1L9N1N3_ASPTC|nr:hypothetical protein ASPTUDRAFT_173987 [Aspergillus tubingensis CBS 134.48]